jgi:two-component system KDP operon response regulator KdpE
MSPLAFAASPLSTSLDRRDESCVIADPDKRWQTYLARTLRERGINPLIAGNARVLEELCLSLEPSLVLVDIDHADFRAVVAECRRYHQGYLIGMTLQGQSSPAAVEALLAGADLVMTKPFTREALLAQLDAIGRRPHEPAGAEPRRLFVSGDFRFDFVNHTVEVAGERVHLSSIQYRLLEALARNPDMVLTHSQLSDMVWGSEEESNSANLRAHIHNLRRLLHDTPPSLIMTERDIGYYMRSRS